MKNLTIGSELYYYYITPIWGTITFTEYEIIGETPKFWRIEDSYGSLYMCDKKNLKIRGKEVYLQIERDSKLDKEMTRQKLMSDILDRIYVLEKNKRKITKEADINSLENLSIALDKVTKEYKK